jgi:hypothetical protein
MTSVQRLPLATAALAALVLGGCATLETRADFDREVGFSELRTFTWLEPTEDQRRAIDQVSPFLERRLERAVESELLERGFVRGIGDNVDFLVTGYVVSQPRGDAVSRAPRTTTSVSVGLGFGWSSWGHWGHWGPSWGWGWPRWGWPTWGWGSPWGYSSFWSPWWGTSIGFTHYPTGYGAPDASTPGTLVVEIFEVGSHKLVWRGWTEGAFLDAIDPDDLAAFVDQTIHEIMLKFPPEA